MLTKHIDNLSMDVLLILTKHFKFDMAYDNRKFLDIE